MKVVKLPDPRTQFEKTPARHRVFDEYADPATGEKRKAPRWKILIEGIGDRARVVRWNELRDRIIDYVRNHTLEDLKRLYKRLTGEDYQGINSKRGVVRALLKFYFNFDEDLTLSELLQRLRKKIVEKAEWGLGCPYSCGRHWIFKPKDDLTGFIPEDPNAYTGTQAEILEEWDVLAPDTITVYDEKTGEAKEIPNPEAGKVTHYYRIRHWDGSIQIVTEVPINRGYLEWRENPDGTVTFKCDRCGGEIILTTS